MTHELNIPDPQEIEETSQAEAKPCKERIAGLHEGQTWMSDDFDEPIFDDEWFNKEIGTPNVKPVANHDHTPEIFAQWRAEAASMTPAEIADEDEGWDEIMENLKNNRLSIPIPDVSEHD